MADGCKNPAAVNYDVDAENDDGSCVYLHTVDGICYRFTDLPLDNNIADYSFTMSYSIEQKNWVFFHDYLPDYYFHTREKLHLIKNKNVWIANTGNPGDYLGEAQNPFFVDVVFRADGEQTLDSLNWISEKFNGDAIPELLDQETLTHITIWNSFQCTGRIPISSIETTFNVNNIRKTKSTWNFNDFRDLVITRGSIFLKDLFNNFAVDDTKLDANKPWYEQTLLEDHYFIVRFEFDNDQGVGDIVLLHDVGAEATPSAR